MLKFYLALLYLCLFVRSAKHPYQPSDELVGKIRIGEIPAPNYVPINVTVRGKSKRYRSKAPRRISAPKGSEDYLKHLYGEGIGSNNYHKGRISNSESNLHTKHGVYDNKQGQQRAINNMNHASNNGYHIEYWKLVGKTAHRKYDHCLYSPSVITSTTTAKKPSSSTATSSRRLKVVVFIDHHHVPLFKNWLIYYLQVCGYASLPMQPNAHQSILPKDGSIDFEEYHRLYDINGTTIYNHIIQLEIVCLDELTVNLITNLYLLCSTYYTPSMFPTTSSTTTDKQKTANHHNNKQSTSSQRFNEQEKTAVYAIRAKVWIQRLQMLIQIFSTPPSSSSSIVYDILLSDLDALWMKDPFPDLQRYSVLHPSITTSTIGKSTSIPSFSPSLSIFSSFEKAVSSTPSTTSYVFSSSSYSSLSTHEMVDIIAQRGAWPQSISRTWGAALSMGFIYMRNSDFTINLLEQMRNKMSISYQHFLHTNPNIFLNLTEIEEEERIIASRNATKIVANIGGKVRSYTIVRNTPLPRKTDTTSSSNKNKNVILDGFLDDQYTINYLIRQMQIVWQRPLDWNRKNQSSPAMKKYNSMTKSYVLSVEGNHYADIGIINRDAGKHNDQNFIVLLPHHLYVRQCIPHNFYGNHTLRKINSRTMTNLTRQATILHCVSLSGPAVKKSFFLSEFHLWKLASVAQYGA